MNIVLIYLFLLSHFSIKNIGINSKPTFSYVIIYLNQQDFKFSSDKREEVINVIIENSELKLQKKEIEPQDNKFIKKVILNEIREDEERKSTAISVIMKNKNLKWGVKKSKNSLLILVGKDIPFVEKKEIDEFLKNAVVTRNYRALDRMFLLAEIGDEETKAKAYFAIGEMLFKMGIESHSNMIILRASTFYGAAGREFLKIRNIKDFALSYIRSSQALRWSMFFPEAKSKSDFALEKISQKNYELPQPIKIFLLCSSALASIGRSKAGEAAEKIGILEKDFLSQITKYRNEVPYDEFQEISDCVFSALGSFEYEKGNFEKAGEYFTYVSDRFLRNDPVALPRYARTLLKLDKTYLSKKYFHLMIDSRFQNLKAEGRLGLFESLYKEGNKELAIKYLYSVMEDFPATKWEVKARLIAVKLKDELKDVYNMLGKKRIPRDDPIFFPEENLKFIIKRAQSPESQIALAEYLKLINEKIEKKKKDVEEKKESLKKEISSDFNFIYSFLPAIKSLKTPTNIMSEIQNNMKKYLENLIDSGNIVYASTIFFSFREFLPPPYIFDYSKIESQLEKFGIIEEEKTKVLQEFESEEDKEKFIQTFGNKFPILFVKYADYLIAKGECERAYLVLHENKDKIYNFEEYNDILFKVSHCLYVSNSHLIEEFCKEEKYNIFCKEYPFETTYDKLIKSLFDELEKIPEKLEEIKTRLITSQ